MVSRRRAETLGTLAKIAFGAQFLCATIAAPFLLLIGIMTALIAGLQMFRNYANGAWNELKEGPDATG